MSSTNPLIFEAHRIASKALTIVNEHKENTDKRFAEVDRIHKEFKDDNVLHNQNVLNAITRVHSRVDKIFLNLTTIGISIIVLLTGIIGYLLTSGVPW